MHKKLTNYNEELPFELNKLQLHPNFSLASKNELKSAIFLDLDTSALYRFEDFYAHCLELILLKMNELDIQDELEKKYKLSRTQCRTELRKLVILLLDKKFLINS